MNNYKIEYLKSLLSTITVLVLCCTLFISCESEQVPEVIEGERILDHDATLIDTLQVIPSAQRRDKNHKGRFITIDDSVSIYVVEKGEGIPLVLINGGPGKTFHSFIPYFDTAEKFAKVIYYDPRGVGQSDWKPGERYSTTQLVNDLEKIREKLGIEKWVVAGWSYGGLAAQYYALQKPKSILGMVLMNSAYSASYSFRNGYVPNYLSEEERERIKEIYSIGDQHVKPEHSELVSQELMQIMVYNGLLNGDWKREFYYRPTPEEMASVALFEKVHDVNYVEQVTLDAYTIHLNELFLNFDKPVLIYYGKHDMAYNTNLATNLASEFQNSELIIMEHSSHHPFKEQPKLFFKKLEKFISKIDVNS